MSPSPVGLDVTSTQSCHGLSRECLLDTTCCSPIGPARVHSPVLSVLWGSLALSSQSPHRAGLTNHHFTVGEAEAQRDGALAWATAAKPQSQARNPHSGPRRMLSCSGLMVFTALPVLCRVDEPRAASGCSADGGREEASLGAAPSLGGVPPQGARRPTQAGDHTSDSGTSLSQPCSPINCPCSEHFPGALPPSGQWGHGAGR